MIHQMSGDAWLYRELDDLKKMATDMPDGSLAQDADAAERAQEKAELDGIGLANPYFP